MSVTARLGRFFDRRFLAGLAIMGCFCALVGALAVLGAADEDEGSLATAYARVSSYALATFVFVPAFVFCVPGAFRPVESELWVTRGGRSRTLGHALARLSVRATAFSAVLTVVGLVAAALSGSWLLSGWVVFGLVTLVLQALFFMVVGLLTLVVRLLTNFGAYVALAAVGYGALDYLLSMTQASTNPLLWTGWFLTLADETDGLAMEVAGGLRLAVGCVLRVALSARLMRGKDFLPKGGARSMSSEEERPSRLLLPLSRGYVVRLLGAVLSSVVALLYAGSFGPDAAFLEFLGGGLLVPDQLGTRPSVRSRRRGLRGSSSTRRTPPWTWVLRRRTCPTSPPCAHRYLHGRA